MSRPDAEAQFPFSGVSDGSEPLPKTLSDHTFARFLFSGVSKEELANVMANLQTSGNWYDAWFSRAQALESRAMLEDESQGPAHARLWLEISALYHFAQYHECADLPAKWRAQDLCSVAYQRCASLLAPPSEPLTFTVDGNQFCGYFRSPSRDGTSPCILLLNGLDSIKEVELHHFSEVFLQHGFATFAFDGPGQGKAWHVQKLSNEWHRTVSAAITTLMRDARVDSQRIGVFGISFGGHLACQAAAMDQRIKAAIDLSGPFDYRFISDVSQDLQAVFCYPFGAKTVDDLFNHVSPVSLQAFPPPTSPILIIHGKLDRIVRYEHAEWIHNWAQGKAELCEYPDGVHNCGNHIDEVTTLCANWLASHI